ncbi:MAG: Gfo/Idh/MocA family oxidoreductase [Hyphomicrobiaceae bacterium]|nr:Gfo/Idh/MocA family oxidoreductase [Hyphomicrobiaceae bacterium]MCC0023359.1 Gfo/Idh/MocA family oxidoreductase [Hyphomicrobiaceae bacterium]
MRLLILGTGGMARAHAGAFSQIRGVKVVAGVDTVAKNLDTFCANFGIANRFSSLEEALEWGEFDAVANVTPDPAHHPTTMKLIEAGKHVFCEKPLATDYEKAKEMADAIEAAGLVGMVNLTYRNVPHLHKARQLVDQGKVGSVKHVEASYLQSWLVSDMWGKWNEGSTWLWRLSTAHGSKGVLGDIGIHILDFMSFGSGLEVASLDARLQTFHKAPGDRIGEYVLDANDSFVMSVGFDNGALGVVHASRWATGHINELRLRIYGDKGGLEVVHNPEGSELRGCLGRDANRAVWKDIAPGKVPTNYEKFAKAVKAGESLDPMFRRAANIQLLLDLAERSSETQQRLSV